MKSQLQDNDVEMFATHNEGKSVVAEGFIRTLKNNDNTIIEYNDTCCTMKHVDVKSSTYIDFGVENKDRKFKLSDQVRISKYKNIFAKGYTPN